MESRADAGVGTKRAHALLFCGTGSYLDHVLLLFVNEGVVNRNSVSKLVRESTG